jgi:Spy/CpxP family protein refolding chaperone
MDYRILIRTGLLAATAAVSLGGPVLAAPAESAAGASAPETGHHMMGEMHGHGVQGLWLQALHQLDLSDAQKEQIRAVTGKAREQWRAEAESDLRDLLALNNPGDPNHDAAIKAAQQRAAQRIQAWSDAQQQIYGLLTPAQQAQLPQLLAKLQSDLAAR